jgi:hypothetical protein
MKKRQVAKPKAKTTRARKTSGGLRERYAELLRLRDEIARLEERSGLSDNSRSQENKI